MTQGRAIDKVQDMEKNKSISPLPGFGINRAKQLLDIMLPPTCPGCRAIVGSPGGLCPDCWEKVTFISGPGCSVCGRPFEYSPSQKGDGAGVICGSCAREAPPFSRARAAFLYDDASRKMVLSFKHADKVEWAGLFSTMLERVGGDLIADCNLIVPVPLTRAKLFSRRYNQSGEIARTLSKRAGKTFAPGLLTRVGLSKGKKPTQGGLSRRGRYENVRGVFKVPNTASSKLAQCSVLLIDDVFTTGATVTSATRALLAAGAKNVDVLTLAMVPGPK